MLLEIIRYRRWWYALSALLIVPGTISLILWGIRGSIDFTGGSLLEFQVPAGTTSEQVKKVVGNAYGEPIVQASGDNAYQVRLKSGAKDHALTPAQNQTVVASLQKSISKKVKEVRLETVGPTIGKEIRNKAVYSVAIGALLIAAYIAYAFRNVPRPASSWRFGFATIIALLHDILFTLGIFSILGHFGGVEVTADFVAAVLTVIGFSVHDSIVVFDRIRENLLRGQGTKLEDTVNFSIVQTLVRSINTSFTVLLVLAAMYLFGGSSISHFVLALLVGIAIGTYSSIFNASPVLVTWQLWSEKRAAKAKA